MNEDGFVQVASVANVAHRARITVEEAVQEIKILESPDSPSRILNRTKDNDGRRIDESAVSDG